MLEETEKKSPDKVKKSRQLGATTLDAIRSMRAMKGEIKAKSPEEQESKMSPDKLARHMKTKEAATKKAVEQATKSHKAIGKQQKKAGIEKIKQVAAEKTKKVQEVPRQAGSAGIHSEIKDRIDAHSKLVGLGAPISDLLTDLNYIRHQVDIAHAQKKLSDTHHEHFSNMIGKIKDAHIARANFNTLQNAIEKNHLPVTKELLDHMHKLSHFEFNPEGDYKEEWNKRNRRVSYLNRLAASIGYKPTTTKTTKRFMGIPYGSKEETKNVYESKEAENEHPYVKVSKGKDKTVPPRTEVAGRASHASGNSSGPDVDEQTIQIIKDVILERTAGRPAPIRYVGHRGSTARAGARAGLPRRGLTRRKPGWYLKRARARHLRGAVSPLGSAMAAERARRARRVRR